jgi:HAD superfamily hydrolase (TIGR01458 family)
VIDFKNIKAIVSDIGGVYYVGDEAIPGAVDAIRMYREKNIPIRFCTNTTTMSDRSLLTKLHNLGIEIEKHELFGAVRAGVEFLRSHGKPKCHFLLTDDPKADFAEFPEDGHRPDFVVIGDSGKDWDQKMMQSIFEMVMRGAEIVALHKGKYWQTSEGLRVDFGAFVAGLEYLTDKTATIVGKPSPDFFRLVLGDLGYEPHEAAMIGDDIDSDIGGAQAVGMKGILVRTGKYRPEFEENSSVTPDLVIDSVAELRF